MEYGTYTLAKRSTYVVCPCLSACCFLLLSSPACFESEEYEYIVQEYEYIVQEYEYIVQEYEYIVQKKKKLNAKPTFDF